MRYHNITRDDMLNGDGLRVVLWVAGCSHCCKECHNPLTWDPDGGLSFDDRARKEIFEQLDKPYISGITFSGGDPLHAANRIYTGDLWENIFHYSLMKYADVVVDGEFKIELKDVRLLWKGSRNQRVIDVQETLRSPDPSIPVLHCGDYAADNKS